MNEMKITKSLPYSLEAEQSVLGILLINNIALEEIYNYIDENNFYKSEHKLIFKHIKSLISNTKFADVITVYNSIFKDNSNINCLNYLNSLIINTPSIINIKHYAKIVRDKSILRKLIFVTNTISEDALNIGDKSIKNILDDAESKIYSISENVFYKNKFFKKIKPLLTDVLDQIEDLYTKKNFDSVTGVSSGFLELDKITSGFQPGDLIIVASRPSMGKTAFSINIAENVILNNNLPVIIFSLEMSSGQLIKRMLSSITKIDHQKIRTGNLKKEEWTYLNNAAKMLENKHFFIDDSSNLNTLDIKNKSRRILRKYGKLGLIVIDYLQLMSSERNLENRASEISEISKNLKGLARELNCPIIALSQLNRSLEQRSNKKPIMSDLRESGALEQDADLILFIYREEVYNPTIKNKGMAEIIISKHRNGPIGNIILSFIGKYIKYENYIYKIY